MKRVVFCITYLLLIIFFSNCGGRRSKADVSDTLQIDTLLLDVPCLLIQPEAVFDTLAHINHIRNRDPRGIGRYCVASRFELKGNDLNHIPPRELRLIRNEIFARYGYRFNDPALRAHFENQDWYMPLFDNVDEFITPLEHANIVFIMEKERTNPDISYEEQFQFFLESYFSGEWKWKEPQIPEMLRHKFYISAFGNNGGHYYGERLPNTSNYVYLIHSVFGGCSGCTYHNSIYKFNKKGELLETFYLGESDDYPHIVEKPNNRYEIRYNFYPGMRYDVGDPDVTDEMWEEAVATPIDTIRYQFYYDNVGQIILLDN